MSPTSLPLCLICIWNQNVQIYGTVSHPKSGPPHRYPASYSSKEKELSFSPTIFFSGSFCTDNELSSPVTTKSFINVPSFLIFTVIAFAQVLTIICLDYCSEELDGLASSLLLSQVFLILLLCIFNKKPIWSHIPKQKKPKVTMSPPHMLFVKGSLLLVRQSSHSLAGHIVTLFSLLVLCSSHVPYTLATPSQLPFTKHVMSFILRFVVFSSAWNTLQNLSAENSSSSIYSSVQQEDNSVYFRGLSRGLIGKKISHSVWHTEALTKC